MKNIGYFLILLSSITTATAAESKGLWFIHADFGGDTLVEVSYDDGSTSSIEAGGGITFGGGATWRMSDLFIVQATAAWKTETLPSASNGSADWDRFPVEVIGLLQIDKFRIGMGLTYHLFGKLKGDGILSSASADFDNATGSVVTFEYVSKDRLSYVFRQTIIDYTPAGTSTILNGNSAGIGINMHF